MISRRNLIFSTSIGASSLLVGCRSRRPKRTETISASANRSIFTNKIPACGIKFTINHPPNCCLNILQTIGHGCAFIDYDNDGWLDILLVANQGPSLYRNNRDGSFSDVTNSAFPLTSSHNHFLGCTIADFDQDGYPDVLLTGYGSLAVYHNRGNGTFEDVTVETGLLMNGPLGWTTSASWAYLDGGKRLSVYIGRYVDFDPNFDNLCPFREINGSTILQACGPTTYSPERGSLHTYADGRFINETLIRGLSSAHGNCLGAMFCDYDNDGRPDLFLANDQKPAELYHNIGGAFRDVALEKGVGYGADGQLFSGMGLYWGDYDNDGMFDLVVSNFAQQPKGLFRNNGGRFFSDESYRSGLGASALKYLTFGAVFIDYDNDGWQDIMMANGHVQSQINEIDPAQNFEQPTQLFQNLRNGQFRNISHLAGTDFLKPIVGRGIAIGDFDRDGRLDAIVSNEVGSPLLLHNQFESANNWLSVRCAHKAPLTDAIGARVQVVVPDGVRIGEVRASGTYLSSDSPWVHFGLGNANSVHRLRVRWPDGRETEHRDLPVNRHYVVTPRSIGDG